MSNTLRIILWSVFSLGMIFFAIMAFWVFLIILGIIIIARFIYSKLFNKSSFTVHTYTMSTRPRNNTPQKECTTVIDADDLDKEYKIPKIK